MAWWIALALAPLALVGWTAWQVFRHMNAYCDDMLPDMADAALDGLLRVLQCVGSVVFVVCWWGAMFAAYQL